MFFKANGLSFYYEKYGDKKPVVLILPGWGNTRNTFTNLITFLKNTHTVYIIDYPGFGNSPLPNKELSIYDYAELIHKFILKEKIKPIIIAHSFGGRIAAILIGKYHLHINKLILIDVAGIKHFNIKVFLKQKIYKFLKLLLNILPLKNKYLYHKKLLKLFSSEDYHNLSSIMKKSFINIVNEDLKKYYKLITCETLIIWGKKDLDTPLKDAYYLRKIIKDSGLIIYNNGHFSYFENSILTNIIINSFLN